MCVRVCEYVCGCGVCLCAYQLFSKTFHLSLQTSGISIYLCVYTHVTRYTDASVSHFRKPGDKSESGYELHNINTVVTKKTVHVHTAKFLTIACDYSSRKKNYI